MLSPRLLCICLPVLLLMFVGVAGDEKRIKTATMGGVTNPSVAGPRVAGFGEQFAASQVASNLAARRRRRRKSSRRRSKSPRRRRRRTAAPPAPPPPPPPPPPPEEVQDPCAAGIASVPVLPEPGQCADQAMCYMFGDPHFITFDGGHPDFNNQALNRFWAVRSSRIHIQGHATGTGSWVQGVAVGGPFLGSHRVTAVRNPNNHGLMTVHWDGEQVLTSPSSSFSALGGKVNLHREVGNTHLPDEADLKKIFAMADKEKNWYQLETVMKAWRESKEIYTFQLPSKVEIHIVWSRLPGEQTAEILIKMPPQASQGGWCGNFNDKKDTSKSDHNAVNPGEDLFKRSGLVMAMAADEANDPQEAVDAASMSSGPCKAEARAMAEHACGHLNDLVIREDCVQDICKSRHIEKAMNAADDIAIMKFIHEHPKQ